jgi:hypothetical protein
VFSLMCVCTFIFVFDVYFCGVGVGVVFKITCSFHLNCLQLFILIFPVITILLLFQVFLWWH